MEKNSDALVAFWNDRSPGAKHMVATAEQYGSTLRTKHTPYYGKEDILTGTRFQYTEKEV